MTRPAVLATSGLGVLLAIGGTVYGVQRAEERKPNPERCAAATSTWSAAVVERNQSATQLAAEVPAIAATSWGKTSDGQYVVSRLTRASEQVGTTPPSCTTTADAKSVERAATTLRTIAESARKDLASATLDSARSSYDTAVADARSILDLSQRALTIIQVVERPVDENDEEEPVEPTPPAGSKDPVRHWVDLTDPQDRARLEATLVPLRAALAMPAPGLDDVPALRGAAARLAQLAWETRWALGRAIVLVPTDPSATPSRPATATASPSASPSSEDETTADDATADDAADSGGDATADAGPSQAPATQTTTAPRPATTAPVTRQPTTTAPRPPVTTTAPAPAPTTTAPAPVPTTVPPTITAPPTTQPPTNPAPTTTAPQPSAPAPTKTA